VDCRVTDEVLALIKSTQRSTSLELTNKVGLKCPSIRPSAKSFFDFEVEDAWRYAV